MVASLSRTGDPRELLLGPLTYGLAMVISTLFFWRLDCSVFTHPSDARLWESQHWLFCRTLSVVILTTKVCRRWFCRALWSEVQRSSIILEPRQNLGGAYLFYHLLLFCSSFPEPALDGLRVDITHPLWCLPI
jgi:hypothetical protein